MGYEIWKIFIKYRSGHVDTKKEGFSLQVICTLCTKIIPDILATLIVGPYFL